MSFSILDYGYELDGHPLSVATDTKRMADFLIPTIDLSPFMDENSADQSQQKRDAVVEEFRKACSEYGLFQIVNHGVPVELMDKAIELSKAFFEYPNEEKTKFGPGLGGPLPTGYTKQPDHALDKHEFLLMFPPGSSFNVYPNNPPELREVLEQVFSYMVKTGSLLEDIVNESLGLPPNFLKGYNNDRSWDFMLAFRYNQATQQENYGLTEHEDGNCFTFVFQDDVNGLEIRKDGQWIPVAPKKGHIVVNMGDVIKVLSNNKFKSTTHRVIQPQARYRHSYVFFYNLQGDKLVEPLPQFTSDIGEPPKYRPFLYKEYQQLRTRDKINPPSRPEDVIRININHYAL